MANYFKFDNDLKYNDNNNNNNNCNYNNNYNDNDIFMIKKRIRQIFLYFI